MGYQAVRMLPLAAIAGVAVAVVVAKRSWRERVSYVLNLAVLAFVSLMVFLPLLHYWTEEPENYMRRASTRVFGDLPTTEEERAVFLAESVPILLSNISEKTALIYHYYGRQHLWSASGRQRIGRRAGDGLSNRRLHVPGHCRLACANRKDARSCIRLRPFLSRGDVIADDACAVLSD